MQRLAGRRELLAALGATSRAEPGVRKRMFDEIMSDAMWSATWVPAKECVAKK